jgi:hypothetical protein
MKIYTTLLLLFVSIFLQACFEEKTDEALLEKDREELNANLYTEKVLVYKMGKICIRASIAGENESAAYKEMASHINIINSKIYKNGVLSTDNLSIIDYVSLYSEYNAMKKLIKETDEDVFPTIKEALSASKNREKTVQPILLSGDEKIVMQNIEHTALSALVMLSQDLGKEVSLYECAKTNTDLLENGQLKGLIRFYRGFLFFEKKLLYLSENEITNNINWLEKNPNIDVNILKMTFKWQHLSDEQAHLAFLSMNHLFRGFDRSMMERDIDENRALEDYQAFVDNCQKLGLNTELTQVIESYLYIKKGDNKKAITALTQLKSSSLLSDAEKRSINETIVYLSKREKGATLNTVVDKYFMSKIATKYVFDMISKIDWRTVFKENKVENAAIILDYIEKYKHFMNTFSTYNNQKMIDKTSSEIKAQGKGLLDKASELIK